MKGMKGRFLKKFNSIPTLSIKQGLGLHFINSDMNPIDQTSAGSSLSTPSSELDDEHSEVNSHANQKYSPNASIASDEESFTSMCSFHSLSDSMESLTHASHEENEKHDECFSISDFEPKCPPGGENSVIFYTTSLRGIRKTFEDCTAIRFLLRSFKIKFYEKDVSMDLELRDELWRVMGRRTVPPQLFIKGKYIGGADQVVALHEQGKLRTQLQSIQIIDHRLDEPCDYCAGVGFVLCTICSGSCKLFGENDEDDELLFIKCSQCNENGLVRCLSCS